MKNEEVFEKGFVEKVGFMKLSDFFQNRIEKALPKIKHDNMLSIDSININERINNLQDPYSYLKSNDKQENNEVESMNTVAVDATSGDKDIDIDFVKEAGEELKVCTEVPLESSQKSNDKVPYENFSYDQKNHLKDKKAVCVLLYFISLSGRK